jgi:hypothetical protein
MGPHWVVATQRAHHLPFGSVTIWPQWASGHSGGLPRYRSYTPLYLLLQVGAPSVCQGPPVMTDENTVLWVGENLHLYQLSIAQKVLTDHYVDTKVQTRTMHRMINGAWIVGMSTRS